MLAERQCSHFFNCMEPEHPRRKAACNVSAQKLLRGDQAGCERALGQLCTRDPYPCDAIHQVVQHLFVEGAVEPDVLQHWKSAMNRKDYHQMGEVLRPFARDALGPQAGDSFVRILQRPL